MFASNARDKSQLVSFSGSGLGSSSNMLSSTSSTIFMLSTAA
jgi:hypothetical protein